MTRYAKRMLAVAALLLSSSVSVQAYESAVDACRKWTGQGGGVQYKCFDCIKRVGDQWVNTCPEDGGHWAWIWVPNR